MVSYGAMVLPSGRAARIWASETVASCGMSPVSSTGSVQPHSSSQMCWTTGTPSQSKRMWASFSPSFCSAVSTGERFMVSQALAPSETPSSGMPSSAIDSAERPL